LSPERAPGNSLLHAFSWTTFGTVLVTGLMFGRSVVVARLLSPDDFGLFGLASIVTSTLAVLTNLSLTASLIPRRLEAGDTGRRVMDTAWTAELGRQIVTSFLLAAVAYPCALYFRDMRVLPVLLAVSVTPALLGLTNVGLTLARKNVDFRTVTLHRIWSEVAGTAVVLLVAYYTRNVWALVISQIAGAAIASALSYAFHPYRPRLAWDWKAIEGGMGFGKSMFAVGVLTLVTTQFDNFVVGRMAPAAILGAYLLAYRLANLPVDIVTDVCGSVLFPAFAASDGGSVRLLRVSILGSTALLCGVLLTMRLLAPELIRAIYGHKWDAAIPLMAALAFQGLFRGIARTVSPFLMGRNRADLDAKAKFVEAAIFVPLTVLLVTRVGAIGAAWAGVASYAVAAILRIVFIVRLVPAAASGIVRDLAVLAVVNGALYWGVTTMGGGWIPGVLFASAEAIWIGSITVRSRR
jgi:O-antigen/teichoic acid export membrane protein